MNRTIASAEPRLTTCYRAALPQMPGPIDGQATLHIDTDGDGLITDARLSGPLRGTEACIAAAVRGRKIANVDTGSASADVPLVFRAR